MLTHAFEARNVAVTGRGTLDGQASGQHWWPWKGGSKPADGTQFAARARLVEQISQGVPVAQRTYGGGSYLRPSFVEPYRCQNVLVEDVTIVNSPMWEIHPMLCTNVTVPDVTVRSHGPNNDGCNPESCRDVLIWSSTFKCGTSTCA